MPENKDKISLKKSINTLDKYDQNQEPGLPTKQNVLELISISKINSKKIMSIIWSTKRNTLMVKSNVSVKRGND